MGLVDLKLGVLVPFILSLADLQTLVYWESGPFQGLDLLVFSKGLSFRSGQVVSLKTENPDVQ